MSESFEVKELIQATPKRLYEAWLDSKEHSAMTGGRATCDPKVGGNHSAWDGWATGANVVLEPYHRIVQTWRSADFPNASPDSRVEIELLGAHSGTTVTLRHTDVPVGQGEEYRKGWSEHYFEPMKKYFAQGNNKFVRP